MADAVELHSCAAPQHRTCPSPFRPSLVHRLAPAAADPRYQQQLQAKRCQIDHHALHTPMLLNSTRLAQPRSATRLLCLSLAARATAAALAWHQAHARRNGAAQRAAARRRRRWRRRRGWGARRGRPPRCRSPSTSQSRWPGTCAQRCPHCVVWKLRSVTSKHYVLQGIADKRCSRTANQRRFDLQTRHWQPTRSSSKSSNMLIAGAGFEACCLTSSAGGVALAPLLPSAKTSQQWLALAKPAWLQAEVLAGSDAGQHGSAHHSMVSGRPDSHVSSSFQPSASSFLSQM